MSPQALLVFDPLPLISVSVHQRYVASARIRASLVKTHYYRELLSKLLDQGGELSQCAREAQYPTILTSRARNVRPSESSR